MSSTFLGTATLCSCSMSRAGPSSRSLSQLLQWTPNAVPSFSTRKVCAIKRRNRSFEALVLSLSSGCENVECFKSLLHDLYSYSWIAGATCLHQALWLHNSSSCLVTRLKRKAVSCTTPIQWCWSQFCCEGCPFTPPMRLIRWLLTLLTCPSPSASRSKLLGRENWLLHFFKAAYCMSISLLCLCTSAWCFTYRSVLDVMHVQICVSFEYFRPAKFWKSTSLLLLLRSFWTSKLLNWFVGVIEFRLDSLN